MNALPLLITAALVAVVPALDAQSVALSSPLVQVANAAESTGPQERVVLLPGGTPVSVHVVGTVSSASMKEGDTFQVAAADDVVINKMVVIRRGALGAGTVGAVDHAGGNGHSGSLTLTFDWIFAADGGKVRLAQGPQTQAEEDRKGASSTATIIGVATFGIGGLFGHNLAHGREVTVDEKKVLNAFVAENVHVRTSEQATQDNFDH